MKTSLTLFLLLFISFFPNPRVLQVYAESETANLGLIEGIWFSQKNYTAGEDLILHTALFNSSDYDVTGIVEFYDNTERLGVREFEIPKQTIKQLSLTTIATEGEHIFSAKISESKTTRNGEVTNLAPVVVDSQSIKIIEPSPIEITTLDNSENTNHQKTNNLLKDVIETLEKYQGSSLIQEANPITELNPELTSSYQEITIPRVELPVSIQQLNEKIPFVVPATIGINNFQNSSVEFFEELRNSNAESLKSETLSQFSHVFKLLWGVIINFSILLLSCLWCVVLVSLMFVYFATKYLFNMLKKNNRS